MDKTKEVAKSLRKAFKGRKKKESLSLVDALKKFRADRHEITGGNKGKTLRDRGA